MRDLRLCLVFWSERKLLSFAVTILNLGEVLFFSFNEEKKKKEVARKLYLIWPFHDSLFYERAVVVNPRRGCKATDCVRNFARNNPGGEFGAYFESVSGQESVVTKEIITKG